ncbi:carbon-monoxide dehydrogenase medium subunit [Paucimonas lemoignei]|uniref:Carbon-monoxide dehydrogenase medium subunit n=1 Tax=Paucimonas lemoignei TaxID=29443 RepID=A0A4R3HV94_PAULE|nr:xanthine dehydrogenase family protein subunit M [Paucimonas lemoignei]TCS34370.1 carbon-monoxide dehydrogenase medium subunit [Paucimonas lemoignei]
MKPPKFDYFRPSTLDEALAALAEANGDGKIIAGGQSLMPMLNFRLLNPAVLIDINRIAELDFLEEQPDGGLRIGALTRHHTMETSPLVKRLFPVANAAMQFVAHLAIRNRGTIGGSITHADPAAELPLMMVLLDAEIVIASSKGRRTVPAEEFFVAALTSAVEEDEIVVEIRLPGLPPQHGWAFEEVARRAGDFALAAVGVVIKAENGIVTESRVGVMGVGDTPMRMYDAETILFNQAVDEQTLDDIVKAVRDAVEPATDLHASGDYRRHLVGVLVRRAVATAWQRAIGEQA